MHWLLAAIATVVAVEIALRTPLSKTVSRWQATAARAMRVVSSRVVSDHWKEIVIPTYALRMLQLTARLTLQIGAVLSPFALACSVAFVVGIPLTDFLASVIGVLFTSVVGMAYGGLRFRRVSA